MIAVQHWCCASLSAVLCVSLGRSVPAVSNEELTADEVAVMLELFEDSLSSRRLRSSSFTGRACLFMLEKVLYAMIVKG